MFKNEEYSSFLNMFTKNLIYSYCLINLQVHIPISTFRVSYKATTLVSVGVLVGFHHSSQNKERKSREIEVNI